MNIFDKEVENIMETFGTSYTSNNNAKTITVPLSAPLSAIDVKNTPPSQQTPQQNNPQNIKQELPKKLTDLTNLPPPKEGQQMSTAAGNKFMDFINKLLTSMGNTKKP